MLKRIFILVGIFVQNVGFTGPQEIVLANDDNTAMSENCSVAAGIPYWDQDRAIESFKSNADVVDQIYVFWYYLGHDGIIHIYHYANESEELIRFARQRGTRVFALIANLPDEQHEGYGDWDAGRVGHIIKSKDHRRKHIADLLELSERHNFDGIHIDYEALPGQLRQAYTDFIKDLADALHKKNKSLAVAIHPKTSADNPDESYGAHAQDYSALARHADQLHIMTYNQYTTSPVPGPAASPKWVRNVLNYATGDSRIPVNKLYFGVPLYAEAWEKNESSGYRWLDIDLTYSDILGFKRKYNVTEHWSKTHQTSSITYRNGNGRKRTAWFENEKSVSRKLEIARELGICNVVLWRLGGEDPGIWQSLRQAGY